MPFTGSWILPAYPAEQSRGAWFSRCDHQIQSFQQINGSTLRRIGLKARFGEQVLVLLQRRHPRDFSRSVLKPTTLLTHTTDQIRFFLLGSPSYARNDPSCTHTCADRRPRRPRDHRPAQRSPTRSGANRLCRGRRCRGTRSGQHLLIETPAAGHLRQRRFQEWCNRFAGEARLQMQNSLGSGVVVHPAGYILTNNHVIEGADEIQVGFADGSIATGTLIGSDPETDLAVIRVPREGLTAITLGASEQVAVGDVALAIGNPFGIGQAVSAGIISAKGRAGISASPYDDFLQTDAAINPGNSGGALLDADGNLIGINTLIFSRSGDSNGIGFAIPAQLAFEIFTEIIEKVRPTSTATNSSSDSGRLRDLLNWSSDCRTASSTDFLDPLICRHLYICPQPGVIDVEGLRQRRRQRISQLFAQFLAEFLDLGHQRGARVRIEGRRRQLCLR